MFDFSIPMEKITRSGKSIVISLSVFTVGTLILMLLFIILLLLLACKLGPWRRYLSSSATFPHRRRPSVEVDDIERPLVAEEGGIVDSSKPTTSYSIEGTSQ